MIPARRTPQGTAGFQGAERHGLPRGVLNVPKPQYTIVDRHSRYTYPMLTFMVVDAKGKRMRHCDGGYLWASKAAARAFIRELGGVEAKPPKAQST